MDSAGILLFLNVFLQESLIWLIISMKIKDLYLIVV